MPETTHQLAAIMTDIIGYTAMMGKSEAKTLEIRYENQLNFNTYL